ncbi:hypothetical protein D3C84_459180 [compost metagenome]
MRRAEFAQALQVGLAQRLRMAQQQRRSGAMEQLDMPDRLRLFQATQQFGQGAKHRLQGLYQHLAIGYADYRLAGGRAESHFQLPRPDVPTHGDARAAPVTEFGPHKWGCPGLRLEAGETCQLFGQGALFQGELFGMGQVLQGAAAAVAGMGAGRHQAQRAGHQHPLGAGFHHLAARGKHARLHLLVSQGTGNEPGTPLDEGDAATVVGQPLDGEPLLLAHRDLSGPRSAAGLEAQASVTPGHWGLRRCR